MCSSRLRDGLSYEGKLYALPFYGESSMLMYRKDLFAAKGLTMPEQPTYDDIQEICRGPDGQIRRHLRHHAARQAGLGRKHGLPQHADQHVRRLLVRPAMETAD